MNVKIRIISEQGGEKKQYTCYGREERTEAGATIAYELEGDSVRLKAEGGKVVMERRGACYLFFPLHEGETTTGKIGLGEEQTGEIGLKTHAVKHSRTEQKTELYIEYDLCFSGQNQRTCLRLITDAEISEDRS
jgi:uncharacterized beta-barrel protein YwiB (DUF1934 family)